MRWILIFVILIFFSPFVKGQWNFSPFGKNRVQSKSFKWKYLSFRNFDVFYYGNNKELAEFAGTYAEENLIDISELLGFTPLTKIKLIIYASSHDYQQSNLGIYDPEFIGGTYTTFIKSKAEIPFNGNREDFKQNIKLGIILTTLNTMFYGGTFKEILQSSYFLSLPEWLVKGAARYLSAGWTADSDNYIRTLVLSEELEDPADFENERAEIAGQSIWSYFVIKYGHEEFISTLNYIRIVKNYKSAIEAATGIPYQQFIQEWREYYQEKANLVKRDFSLPPDSGLIFMKRGRKISSFDIMGNKIAFSSTKNNLASIRVYENNRIERIARSGSRVFVRKANNKLPIVRWINEKQLLIASEGNAGIDLKIYNSKGKRTGSRQISLTNINDISISEDGSYFIVTGAKDGQADLFLYSLSGNKLIQLTNDKYDELSSTHISEDKAIFSSNMPCNQFINTWNYKLFSINTKTRDTSCITNFPGNFTNPQIYKGNLYFLKDVNGIRNLFKKTKDGEIFQVTNLAVNIDNYRFADENTLIAELTTKGTSALYSISVDPSGRKINGNISGDSIEYSSPDPGSIQPSIKSSGEIDIYNYIFESELSDTTNKGGNPSEENKSYTGPYNYENRFTIENVNPSLIIDPLRGLGILIEAGMTDILENHKIYAGIFGLSDIKLSNIYGEYQYLKHRFDFHVRYERKTVAAVSQIGTERYALNTFKGTVSYPFNITKRISFSPFISTTRYTPMYVGFYLPDSTRFYFGSEQAFVLDNSISRGLNIRKGTRARISLTNYFSPDKNLGFSRFLADVRNYLPVYKTITFASRFSFGQFFGKSPKSFLLGGVDNWIFNTTDTHVERDPLLLTSFVDNSDILFLDFVTPLRGFDYNRQFGNKYFLINAELRIPFAGILYPAQVSSGLFRNLQVIGFSDFGAAWTGRSPFSRNNSLNTRTIDANQTPFSAVVFNYKSPYLGGIGFGARTLLLGFFVKLDVAWGIADQGIQDRQYYLSFGYDF